MRTPSCATSSTWCSQPRGTPAGERRRRRPCWSPPGPAPSGRRRTRPRRARRHAAGRRAPATRASPGDAAPGAGSRGCAVEQVLRRARQGSDEQRGAPGVGGGVGVRDGVRQQSPGDLGRQRVRRDVGRGHDPAVDRRPDGVPLVVLPARDDEAAVRRGRDVVGMPLELRGQPEQGASSSRRSAPVRDQGPGQREPADDRRRGRAEAPGVRDRVVAGRAGVRGPSAPSAVEPRLHRADDQVGLVPGHRVGALAGHLDDQARRGAPPPRARRGARGPGRASRSPGPGWPRSRAPRPGPGPARSATLRPARRPRPRRSRRCRRPGRPAGRRPRARSRCP